jgi:hypothetical protein
VKPPKTIEEQAIIGSLTPCNSKVGTAIVPTVAEVATMYLVTISELILAKNDIS